jgi:hypothetical protein
MRSYIFSIPVAVFLVVGFVGTRGFDLMDPRLVRRPGGFWTPVRLLRDDEWTADGLLARRRLFRTVAASLGAFILALIAVLAIAGPG